MIGKRFGRLVVLERTTPRGEKHPKFKCICDCGTIKDGVCQTNLSRGHVMSCGCLRKELTEAKKTNYRSEYMIWRNMNKRCHDPNNKSFRDYGERGIEVCPQWRNSFKSFLADMGLRPSKDLTLERIDNNGNYCPENCRWATRLEQNNNSSNCAFVTYMQESMSIAELSRRCGIPFGTLWKRIQVLNWPIDLAADMPIRKRPSQIKSHPKVACK